MSSATITKTATATKSLSEATDTTTDEFLTIVAGQDGTEYAPGRINNGRQASFDAVSAWNAAGRID